MAELFAKLSDLEQKILLDIIPQVADGEQMADELIVPRSEGTEETYEIRFRAAEKRYLRMKGLVSATLERMQTVQAENDRLKQAAPPVPIDEKPTSSQPPQQPSLQEKYAEATVKLKVYQSSITAMEFLYAKDKSMREDLFDYEEQRRESQEVIKALCKMIKSSSPLPPSFDQEEECRCPGCQEIIKNLEKMARSNCAHQVLAAERRFFVFGYYASRIEPYEKKLQLMGKQLDEARMTIKKFEQITGKPSVSAVQH